MYTVYNIIDLDKKAKKEVDRLFTKGHTLHYTTDQWELIDYDFTLQIPFEMDGEHYPRLNITVELKHRPNREPNQTISFAEYL